VYAVCPDAHLQHTVYWRLLTAILHQFHETVHKNPK